MSAIHGDFLCFAAWNRFASKHSNCPTETRKCWLSYTCYDVGFNATTYTVLAPLLIRVPSRQSIQSSVPTNQTWKPRLIHVSHPHIHVANLTHLHITRSTPAAHHVPRRPIPHPDQPVCASPTRRQPPRLAASGAQLSKILLRHGRRAACQVQHGQRLRGRHRHAFARRRRRAGWPGSSMAEFPVIYEGLPYALAGYQL